MSRAANILRLAVQPTNAAQDTGWIRRDGRWLACAYGEHLDAAAAAGERHPDAAGWVHVHEGVADPVSVEPRPAQVEALVALTLRLGRPLPAWLAEWA